LSSYTYQEDYDIDKFLANVRRHSSLETLREDLSVYMKILQNALVELINRDYADFVNLSSNLVSHHLYIPVLWLNVSSASYL